MSIIQHALWLYHRLPLSERDVLLQRYRDTEAAKAFLTRLLGEYNVPEVIHTDQLQSYAAAFREITSLVNVDHQQVISTARCNNLI